MDQLKSKWKNLSKEIKWSIVIVATFVVVGSIIVGVSFGLHPPMSNEYDTSSVVSSHVSEVSSITSESEVVSEVIDGSVSSQVAEPAVNLNNYSGYWYNSSDLERFEFKFYATGNSYGEFTLSIHRLGTVNGTCELTSSNVATFVSNSSNGGYMNGTLTFNNNSIEIVIANPDSNWPSYVSLDQPNGSSPLVINAPEVDYNDPTYVPEDAYGPNGEKYAADAADIPQPTVVCPQCGTKFFDTASFIDGVCDSCYQANNQPIYCSACWNHVTDKSHGGYCESCWNKVQQGLTPGPDPNVWCPDCGTGSFVSGVGTDGIYCEVCQKYFMP